MSSEAQPSADDGGRSRLIRKFEIICDRVVRGLHATDRWQVKVHRGLRIASITLSTLAAAGLIADKVKPDLGLPVLGAWISLGVSILLQIANELEVEKTALESRSAAQSFSWVETSLDIVLVEENPVELVNKLLVETNALLQKFHTVMPRFSEDFGQEAKAQATKLIQRYGKDWHLPPERRRKG